MQRAIITLLLVLLMGTAVWAGSIGNVKARRLDRMTGGTSNIYDGSNGNWIIGNDQDRNPATRENLESSETVMRLRVTYNKELDVVGFELFNDIGVEAADAWMSRATFEAICREN